MSTPCKNDHPLRQTGVSQEERVLAALLPGFVQVDEREYSDLILFASRYAAFLKYYNRNNQVEGDWEPFMLMDVSVTLARLIRLDMQEYRTYVNDVYAQIAATDTAQEADLKKYFKTLFDLCFSVTRLLDEFYRALPEDFGFREVLGNAVRSQLPEYLVRLQGYYGEAIHQGLIDSAGTFLFDDRPRDLIFSQDFRVGDLSDIWTTGSMAPPLTPSFNGSTIALKIKNTATHNLFTSITDQYLKTLARLVAAAPAYLERTMSEFPSHSPHYALFLTFIKLFRISQERLNSFTGRHLDLYYRDILRLKKKEPLPDTVHLLFELSKTAGTGVLLEQGTLFKAGKDRDGQELFYELPEPALLGKGKVAALKNTLATWGASGDEAGVRRISAGHVADSGDGAGAPLQHADKSWEPFGATGRAAGRAGFGIASDYLFLGEGKRTITFTFPVAGTGDGGRPVILDAALLERLFIIELSGEKGWFQVTPAARNFRIRHDKRSFSVTLTLDGGDPPIVPWSESLHEGYQFGQGLPVALFTLADGAAEDALWKLRISGVSLKVAVEGIRSLQVENDEGALNPVKPFDLFGAVPQEGAAFTIGCREFFMKARRSTGSRARLSLTWDDHDVLTKVFDENPGLGIYYLEDSEWKEEPDSGSRSLFTISGGMPASGTNLEIQLPALDVETDYAQGGHYTPRARWGFLKLILRGELGHADYARRLAESIEVTASQDDDGNTTTSINMGDVKEPYTPRVREITLDYEVSTEVEPDAGATDARFIHLTPFGHLAVPGDAFPCTLLPAFPNEGELFIGLDQLQTGQTLPLLFQVAEGTADPLAEKQEVRWHYLGPGNQWELLLKEEIADATGGLLQTGIIQFSIPSSAARNSTLMGTGLHWLKASVARNTQAIPRIVSVRAQAAAARFSDYQGKGNYVKEPLPPGTISKLLTGDPAIKKIEQPAASFGGRTREDDASWYRWVSERLRHKQRAVAPWDYERLVLEAFPDIYKVKCISHARAGNMLSPGHVLVVPVPDLRGREVYDPLRPLASLGLLEEIRKFLSGLASPHVKPEVRNPLFEEIQLEFDVQYRSDDSNFFTRKLRAELEQFLAPWAFDPGSDIRFGSSVRKSSLINFIEERPYVDFISRVKMYRIAGGVRSGDLEEVVPGSCRSVLVSVKAADPLYSHIIHETVCAC